MFALLYWAAPNVKQPGFRWITPGGVLAVVVWIIASAAFALYVANFGSYNKTYGALGGVIVFLVWLWISNIAILLGAEFNAELERGRAIEAGCTRRTRSRSWSCATRARWNSQPLVSVDERGAYDDAGYAACRETGRRSPPTRPLRRSSMERLPAAVMAARRSGRDLPGPRRAAATSS